MNQSVHDLFDLSGKTAIITGGAGLLGYKHAEALMEYGANCVLVDINKERVVQLANELTDKFSGKAIGLDNDITIQEEVSKILDVTLSEFKRVDIIINNAANNPKFEDLKDKIDLSKRFETFPIDAWQKDIDVGLKGAFICAQVFGSHMASNGGGIILNIASDLGIIAPDQRIYRREGIADDAQPTKPITYSVVKHGLIGLTKYIATYWADKGIRCNALVPGGVYTGQDELFLNKLTNLIPLGRMADKDEYKAAIVFMCSNASAYMTGASLVMEGGRTCW